MQVYIFGWRRFSFPGVAPPSFGYITAGVEVHKLTTTGDVMTFQSITVVIVSALLSLAPVLFRRQLRRKLEWQLRRRYGQREID